MAAQPTKNEIRYKELFSFYDKNNVGVITGSEFASILGMLGRSPTEEETKDMLKGKDEIQLADFLRLMTMEESKLMDAFRVFDPNRTGLISEDEFREVMTSLGEKFSEDEMDELMTQLKRSIDLEPDGQINYIELVPKMITELFHPPDTPHQST